MSEKKSYRVRPGCFFGAADEYKAGAMVELTAEEAAPFLGYKLDEAVEESAESTGDNPPPPNPNDGSSVTPSTTPDSGAKTATSTKTKTAATGTTSTADATVTPPVDPDSQ